MNTPTDAARKLAETIDELFSCGNSQSSFAYPHAAALIDVFAAERVREAQRAGPDKVLRCAFCGEPHPDGTPTHKSEILAAHIRVCKVHPVGIENREIRDERDQLKAEVDAINDVLPKRGHDTLGVAKDVMADLQELRDDLAAWKKCAEVIKAPAKCLTCGRVYNSPTTGKLLDRCACGGRLVFFSNWENVSKELAKACETALDERTNYSGMSDDSEPTLSIDTREVLMTALAAYEKLKGKLKHEQNT
jgi:hypothetical protein